MRYSNETRKMTPGNAILVGIIFNLLGFGLIFFIFYPELMLARKSVSWPTTEAYIRETALNRDNENRKSFLILYTYSVDGKEYSSGKVSVGSDSRNSNTTGSGPRENYEKYKKDTSVTAYYDPERPSYAVLEPGVQHHHYTAILFLSLFPIMGACIFLWGLIHKKDRGSWEFHERR